MGIVVNTLTLKSREYPESLRHIHAPPSPLFYTGAPLSAWLDSPKVAIVGSRKYTAYGKQVTENFARELAVRGVTIISGLALGIDSIAHRTALSSAGTAVAVLPTPLDKIYPPSHQNLADQIIKSGGTILSETKSGGAVFKANFITRNRIVSALADVLLITEAAVKSGTMHTARFALDQGKTVMAVPGDINRPSSEGCNNLIKSGAVAATGVNDVLFALGINNVKKIDVNSFAGDAEEKLILSLIERGISDQEELAVLSKLDGTKIASTLTILEISGYVRPDGGGKWSLS